MFIKIKKLFGKFIINKFGIIFYEILVDHYQSRKKRKSGFFANNKIDIELDKLMPFKDGYYVDVGAHDGKTASNTYYFEKKKNWKGILVEPSPNLVIKCQKNRSKKNIIFCCACVNFEYNKKYVNMIYGDSMTISESLELLLPNKREFVLLSKQHLRENESNFEFGAIARNLNSLLIEAGAPNTIDLLSIDTEGAELDVLNGINFKKYLFKYIILETRDKEIIKDYLYTKEYRLVSQLSQQDYLFAHRSLSNLDFKLRI
jgi:FkbM family methyltransferase